MSATTQQAAETPKASKPRSRVERSVDYGHGNVYVISEKAYLLIEVAAEELKLPVKDVEVLNKVCEDLVGARRQDMLLGVLVYARVKLGMATTQLTQWRSKLHGPQGREFTAIVTGLNRRGGTR